MRTFIVFPYICREREGEETLRLQNTLLDYNEAAEIVTGISVEDSYKEQITTFEHKDLLNLLMFALVVSIPYCRFRIPSDFIFLCLDNFICCFLPAKNEFCELFSECL